MFPAYLFTLLTLTKQVYAVFCTSHSIQHEYFLLHSSEELFSELYARVCAAPYIYGGLFSRSECVKVLCLA